MKAEQYKLQLSLLHLKEKKGRRKLVMGLLIWCICIWGLLHRMYGISVVGGNSMRPSFCSGDIVVFQRHVPKKLEYGDALIIRSWLDQEKDYIKRVAGLPQDVVSVDERGYLVRNGSEIREAEVIHGYQETDSPITYPYRIPDGSFFVLGDNRSVSLDSRTFGSIPEKQIIGKVVAVIRIGGV